MKDYLFRVQLLHTVKPIDNGHTGNPWRYGETNITFFALGMRMAVGGTIDRRKMDLNGGR